MHDPPTDAPSLWTKALDNLRPIMTRAAFEAWLRGTKGHEYDGDTLIVVAPSERHVDWLANHMIAVVERAVASAAGRDVKTQFTVAAPSDDTAIMETVVEKRMTLSENGRTFGKDDYYIKLKLKFRERALGMLKGAPLSVFICLALHVGPDGVSHPGIERIMRETQWSRVTVCAALEFLERERFVERLPSDAGAVSLYRVNGYAWFGKEAAGNTLEDGATTSSSRTRTEGKG